MWMTVQSQADVDQLMQVFRFKASLLKHQLWKSNSRALWRCGFQLGKKRKKFLNLFSAMKISAPVSMQTWKIMPPNYSNVVGGYYESNEAARD
jgi:hypothetical protein